MTTIRGGIAAWTALPRLCDPETDGEGQESCTRDSSNRREPSLARIVDSFLAELDQEARSLVRSAIIRVVEMDPERVDESLIEKALTGAAKRA